MSEKRLIVTNTLANGMAQFASMLAGLILMPWLIRAFGTGRYGLYMLAGAVAGYASLMDFGVGSAVVKKVAERAAVNDTEGVHKVASTALAFYLFIGALVATLSVVIALNTHHIFKLGAQDSMLLRNMLLVVAISAIFTWPLNTFTSVLAGYQRFTLTARTSLIASLGSIVVALLVLAMHQGPFAMIIGTSAVGIATGVVNFLFARKQIGPKHRVSPLYAERQMFVNILSFSWAVFVIQICVLILYQQTDRMILGIFVGAVAVGLYEAAGKFQGLVQQLAGFSTSAVMPLASNLESAGRDSALQTLFLRGSKYTVALIAPVVVSLIVFARPILLHWIGPQFAAEALAAQILISHQLLTISTPVGDNILVGLGKLPKRLPNAVALAVGNLLLSLALVKPLGILGVVIGTALPYFMDYPFHIRLIMKELNLPYSRLIRSVVLPTYPALGLTLAIGLVASRTALMDSLAGIMIAAMVAIGAYWLVLFFFALSEVERAEVNSLISRVRLKLTRS